MSWLDKEIKVGSVICDKCGVEIPLAGGSHLCRRSDISKNILKKLDPKEFEKQLLCIPKPQEPLLNRQEIAKIMENSIRFDEEYRRGVHENWGGRPITVYDILYRLVNENIK